MTYREALIKIAQEVQPSEDLMQAIRMVESSNGRNIYGDWIPGSNHSNRNNARAWGVYQQHKINVDDANRILGTNYTYEDRLDATKSGNMVRGIMTYYGNRPGVTPSDETFARIHNGGPNGHNSDNTLGYWGKVQTALQDIADQRAQQNNNVQQQVRTDNTQQQTEPVQQAAAAQQTPATTYTVKAGDTAWNMWKNRTDKSITWPAYQKNMETANPGVDLSKLKIGQKLNIQ